ncbi:NADH-quinone oxidoreductase subunit C [Candidatus Gracilibacteria bacterium]|nr:NADH-quinone oxidoreductase subunit C [Candidatus Gracilibacteria bacterium]
MTNSDLLRALQERFGATILDSSDQYGELQLHIRREELPDVARLLHDSHGFDYLENLCGVDYLGREPRFEVVYHLLAIATNQRLCLKVGAPEQDARVPSLIALWPTATYQEREVYDLFGITFDGHEHITRILLPDDWVGHPLRKDVPLGDEEIAFTFNQERIYAHKPFAQEGSLADVRTVTGKSLRATASL